MKHLDLFLITCKGIMFSVTISSLFCSSMRHKKLFTIEVIFFGGLTQAESS